MSAPAAAGRGRAPGRAERCWGCAEGEDHKNGSKGFGNPGKWGKETFQRMLCRAGGHPNDSESHRQGVITLTPLHTLN